MSIMASQIIDCLFNSLFRGTPKISLNAHIAASFVHESATNVFSIIFLKGDGAYIGIPSFMEPRNRLFHIFNIMNADNLAT